MLNMTERVPSTKLKTYHKLADGSNLISGITFKSISFTVSLMSGLVFLASTNGFSGTSKGEEIPVKFFISPARAFFGC